MTGPASTPSGSPLPRPGAARKRTRRLAVAAAGTGLAMVVLVVAINLDRALHGPSSGAGGDAPRGPIDVVAPAPLDTAAAARTVEDIDLLETSGGWSQIAGADGRLAQQYRFARLDPNPPGMGAGWVHMTRPELEVYMRDGRVVTLEGESALAYAPSREVESGRIAGDVVIRMYEDITRDGPRAVDPRRDVPSAIVRTPQAQLDNVLGRVHCPDSVHLESARGEFAGHVLTILIDDEEDVLRLLHVERVDFIRLVGDAARTAGSSRHARGDALEVLFSARSEPADAPPATGAEGASPGAAPDADAPSYLLTLHDEVTIVEGAGGAALAIAEAPRTRQLAPPPRAGDTVVTCTGGLSVEPVTDPARRLPSPRDSETRLVGSPVRLDDPSAEATAQCGVLVYRSPAGRVELHSSDSHPLEMRAPRMDAQGDLFWIERDEQRAGFVGPGTANLSSAADDQGEGRAVRIDWSGRADLAFAAGAGEGDLGPLESASFAGAVRAHGREIDVAALTGGADDPARGPREGSLHAESLALTFAGDDARRTVRTLSARGGVSASDESQSLWADALDVTFAARKRGAGADEDLDIEHAHAAGEVALRLDGGRFVFGDELDVDGARRTALLAGREVRILDGAAILDQAERLRVNDALRRSSIEGRGRLRRFAAPVVLPAAGTRPRLADLAGAPDVAPALTVTWRDGADLGAPAGAGAEDSARRADFHGAVRVESDEVAIDEAEEVRVHFRAGDGRETIESVEASGAVRARSLGEVGSIRAEHVRVEMTAADEGNVAPARLVASGDVEVADAAQTMWSDTLTVTFRPGGADTAAPAEPAPAKPLLRRAAVDEVRAAGDVQILLERGERVFADRLEARAGEETADLFGQRIVVVADAHRLDRVAHLVLDRRLGTYTIDGSGVYHGFAEPDDSPIARRRLSLPEIAATPVTEATWTQRAEYTGGEDGGALELIGAVRAVSRGALEQSTVDSTALVITFAPVTRPVAGSADVVRTEAVHFLARGEARLESRRWRRENRTDAPRVLFVTGPHVAHDLRTFESHVLGAGELLVRSGEAEEGAPATDEAPFSGRGTTLMRWRDRLDVTPAGGDLLDVSLAGDVTCIHSDDDGSSSTLTGELVRARVLRTESGAAPAGGALDFGSALDARRFSGEGAIFIDTPTREITCDAFDYDLDAGSAELRAAPGRLVYVREEGSAVPLRHERLRWDLDTDAVTVVGGGG